MASRLTDDTALVARLRRGDDEAFAAFFDGMFPRVYRFALARVGGREDAAEEVAQATLCQVVRHLESWRGEAELFTWICAICRREIENWRRVEGRMTAIELAEDAPDVRKALDALATNRDVQSVLEQSQAADLVRRLLDYLPTQYARALEWKYLDELPVRQIAERLDTTEKAAESLLTRARTAFRALLTSAAPHLVPSSSSTSSGGAS